MKTLTKIIVIATIVATAATTNAQSLQFGVNGKHIENNSVLYYFGTPWMPEFSESLKLYIHLTNNTNSQITVEGNFDEENGPTGARADWCIFDNCWPDPVLPPSPMAANAKDWSENESYIQVLLNENYDPATYKINFNVVSNPSDKISITIHFVNRENMPNDLISQYGELENDTIIFVSGGYDQTNIKPALEMPKIAVYPNPATDHINFEMGEERGSITIYSATGNVVRRMQAASGNVLIDVKGLTNGIYFYRVESAGRQTTGKFIVK